MNSKTVRTVLCPLLTAAIWGTAFVFQRIGAGYMGAFTFSGARSLVAAVFIGLMIALRRRHRHSPAHTGAEKKRLLLGGLLCGLLLTVATNLQQFGLSETSAGKAGFITSLYIVLVPLFGLFIGKKIPAGLWVSVVVAVAGLYLLCVTGDFSLSGGDLLIMLCAVVFSCHILTIDHFVKTVDPLELSCAQFAVTAALSWLMAFITETPSWEQLRLCMGSILYVGVFSSGVAYTLQIVAQKSGNPVTVTLLLSLESVFSVLAGVVFLEEMLSLRELLGCVVMLCAVVMAQLPEGFFKKRKLSRQIIPQSDK